MGRAEGEFWPAFRVHQMWLPRSLSYWFIVAAVLAATSAVAAPPKPKLAKEGVDFFEKKVRPILVHNCYECHSGDAAKAKGHLLLDSAEGLHKGGDSGAVVMPGNADDSLLVQAIRYEGLEMPPKGQLDEAAIQDIVDWVNMGAPDPRVGKAAKPRNKVDLNKARKYWAFKQPKLTPPPEVNDSRWPHTNIDRFVRGAGERASYSGARCRSPDAHPSRDV